MTIITNPWECLCVDLIGPYTLKGKDNLQINFMALTMINLASSWFEITELPVLTQLCSQTVNGKELLIADKIFDKILECIVKLVNKTWLCRYPRCHYLIYNNGSEFKLYFKYLCKSYGIKRKPMQWLRIHKQMAYWNMYIKSLDRCYAQLKLIWLIQLPPMTLMSFLRTWHGQFALPITRYLKPHQVQPFLDVTCS